MFAFTKKFFKDTTAIAVASSIVFGVSMPVQAELEEIIVLAQKREQSLQDVGISVSAFTGDELNQLNVNDVPGTVASIPNVQVNYGFGPNSFNIRGLGANEFGGNLDPAVAVHVDEVYYSKSFMSTLLLFDIKQLEVVKGPQGTLFGKNTTGGSLNFYTNKPTEEFEASGTLGFGNFSTTRAEGYIGGALSENLNGRLSAFSVNQSEGFFDNSTTGQDEGLVDMYAVRGQLQWELDGTSVNVTANYGEDNSEKHPYEGVGKLIPGTTDLCPEAIAGTVTGSTPGCVRGTDGLQPGDDDPFTTTGFAPHTSQNTGYGLSVRVDHDLENAVFTSLSSFNYYERDQQEIGDESPEPGIFVFWYNEIMQYTQEFRLTSSGLDNWDYVLGGYLQYDDYTEASHLTFGAVEPADEGALFTEFDQDALSAAIFFHNTFKVTDTLSFTAGMRYNWERTEVDGTSVLGQGIQGFPVQRPVTIDSVIMETRLLSDGGNRQDENASFKFGVDWTPASVEDLLVYANVTTGFRSGGYNLIFAGQDGAAPLDPEEITSYEVGYKSTLLDNRMRLNGALFRYDFQNGRLNTDRPGTFIPFTINAAEVEAVGVEIEMQYLPVDALELNVSLGWADAEIKSEITESGRNLQGNTPINTPELTFSAAANYSVTLSDNVNGIVGLNFNWRDEQFQENSNTAVSLEEAYWLIDARAALQFGDQWEVSVWGKNLGDKEYRTYVNDLTDWILNIYGPPRTFGFSINYKM